MNEQTPIEEVPRRIRIRRTRAQQVQFSRQVTRLYFLKKLTFRDIQDELEEDGVHVSLDTIHRYVTDAIEGQQKKQAADTQTWIDEKLLEIQHLKSEAWDAWERSQLDEESEQEKEVEGGKDGGRSETTKNKKGQVGDPRFLERYESLCREENKIKGLYAPEKREISGDLRLASMTDEQLVEFLKNGSSEKLHE